MRRPLETVGVSLKPRASSGCSPPPARETRLRDDQRRVPHRCPVKHGAAASAGAARRLDSVSAGASRALPDSARLRPQVQQRCHTHKQKRSCRPQTECGASGCAHFIHASSVRVRANEGTSRLRRGRAFICASSAGAAAGAVSRARFRSGGWWNRQRSRLVQPPSRCSAGHTSECRSVHARPHGQKPATKAVHTGVAGLTWMCGYGQAGALHRPSRNRWHTGRRAGMTYTRRWGGP